MESYLIHVRYMCEDGGSGWESNPPPPTMRSRPLVLKTRASTGTQPLPLPIVTARNEIVNATHCLKKSVTERRSAASKMMLLWQDDQGASERVESTEQAGSNREATTPLSTCRAQREGAHPGRAGGIDRRPSQVIDSCPATGIYTAS